AWRARALGGLQVVKLHAFSPASVSVISSTLTRKRTCRTMPRVAGLSVMMLVLPIPWRPRARTVARLRAMWLIVLLTWVTLSLAATRHLPRERARRPVD